MNTEETLLALNSWWANNWTASPTDYDGSTTYADQQSGSWARLTILPGKPRSFLGQYIRENQGMQVVSLFARDASLALNLGQRAETLIQDAITSPPSGVTFETPYLRVLGQDEHGWYRTEVSVDYHVTQAL